ncbi:MAG: peptidoglycan-binding domain-containing protein [Rhodospirillales bacterium]
MMRSSITFVAAALFLTACGNTSEERGITGAGLGAAGGAMLGAVTGLSVLQGAIIGTAAGGAAGLLTNKDTLNIGDPIWKRKSSQPTSANTSAKPASMSATGGAYPSADPRTVESIQRRLAGLGYKPGPMDGKPGPRTRDAIRNYQRDNGLVVNGEPTPALANHMEHQEASR